MDMETVSRVFFLFLCFLDRLIYFWGCLVRYNVVFVLGGIENVQESVIGIKIESFFIGGEFWILFVSGVFMRQKVVKGLVIYDEGE